MSPKLQGEVVYLYAFDVAEEIQTAGVRKILSEEAAPFAPQSERFRPSNIPIHKPLLIDPRRENWKFKGLSVQPAVRVYDIGVISIIIAVPFDVEELRELISFHHPCLDDQQALDRAAYDLSVEVMGQLRDYLVRPIDKVDIPEAYTVFGIRKIEDETNAEDWVQRHRQGIAGLLSETHDLELSNQQVEESFRHSIGFNQGDRTVIEWDAALVVDLGGPIDDVLHVLELANLQLEELVLMDKRIDAYLDQAYEVIEKEGRKFLGLKRGELDKLRRFRISMAKIGDEVSNISKFFGDWYLARIYMGARERFHLATWRESIQNRLSNLDNLYEVLRSEGNEARMLILEVLIVLLFILDLVAVFLKK